MAYRLFNTIRYFKFFFSFTKCRLPLCKIIDLKSKSKALIDFLQNKFKYNVLHYVRANTVEFLALTLLGPFNRESFPKCSGFQNVYRGTLGCRQKFKGCRKFFLSIRNIQAILSKFG